MDEAVAFIVDVVAASELGIFAIEAVEVAELGAIAVEAEAADGNWNGLDEGLEEVVSTGPFFNDANRFDVFAPFEVEFVVAMGVDEIEGPLEGVGTLKRPEAWVSVLLDTLDGTAL